MAIPVIMKCCALKQKDYPLLDLTFIIIFDEVSLNTLNQVFQQRLPPPLLQ